MRVSERGQITIPKALKQRSGMNPGVEVVVTPTEHGLLIQKRMVDRHPVERVYGVLSRRENTDDYLEVIRGR